MIIEIYLTEGDEYSICENIKSKEEFNNLGFVILKKSEKTYELNVSDTLSNEQLDVLNLLDIEFII